MRTLRIIARHNGSPVPHLDFYAASPPMRRWLPLGEVVEVRFMPEWVTEIRAGVVIAADAASAKLAGVQFDKAAVDEAMAPEAPAEPTK